MKDEIVKVLDLLEKGVISSDEANNLINNIKKLKEDEISKEETHKEKTSDEKYEKIENDDANKQNNTKSHTNKDFIKNIEEAVKDLGDHTNEIIKKVQPKIFEVTGKVLENVAEGSRKVSDHIDKNMTSSKQKTKTTESENEADDIINKYKEECDNGQN